MTDPKRFYPPLAIGEETHVWSDTFDRNVGQIGAGHFDGVLGCSTAWTPTRAPKPGEATTITCNTCGNVVTMCEGDDPIPYGDPRLCEHMGRKP